MTGHRSMTGQCYLASSGKMLLNLPLPGVPDGPLLVDDERGGAVLVQLLTHALEGEGWQFKKILVIWLGKRSKYVSH